MVRLSLVLVLSLAVLSCSLASPFESSVELIAAASRGKALYGKFLQWRRDQPADSNKSFATFYKLLGKAVNRQLAQREIDEEEPSETIELGHDNGELQNLYEEWKTIQPDGSSDSFENYLEWLRDQRSVRELNEPSDAAEDAVIDKRGCTWGCKCCPVWCGIICRNY